MLRENCVTEVTQFSLKRKFFTAFGFYYCTGTQLWPGAQKCAPGHNYSNLDIPSGILFLRASSTCLPLCHRGACFIFPYRRG